MFSNQGFRLFNSSDNARPFSTEAQHAHNALDHQAASPVPFGSYLMTFTSD